MKTKTIPTILQILTQHTIINSKKWGELKKDKKWISYLFHQRFIFYIFTFYTHRPFHNIFNPNREMDLFLIVLFTGAKGDTYEMGVYK